MSYVFLPSFILSVFLLLRVGSPALAFGCSHLVLPGIFFYLRREISWKEIAVFLLLIAFSYGVSWCFFDFFHDALAYFQPAIRRIAEGFSPAYDGYMDFGRSPDVWSDASTFYPKAAMYFAACALAALGDIQPGKTYHILLLFSALFYAIHVTRNDGFLKKCLWILACLNPIALTQWTSLIIDGALASLSLIGLLFANAFFTQRSVSRLEYALGVMALSFLFCVKTTGFAYGSVILFFICLHRLYAVYRENENPPAGRRFFEAFKSATVTGLRLGGTVLLLSAVIGFNPYLTNLREGRHIFYPLVQGSSLEKMDTAAGLEDMTNIVYPEAHNRFTRFLFSIFAHPNPDPRPARLKNPFSAPLSDWWIFGNAYNLYAGGLGPLFGLLLCLAVLAQVLSSGRGNLWLWLTLLMMTFIQPHAWVLRYSPFVWLFPFLCLDAVPQKKSRFLIVPLLIALVNSGGVFYFLCAEQWRATRMTTEDFAPHCGETVFLDRTIFEFDGIFNRFDLKQKYVNPEEAFFFRYPGLRRLGQDASPMGVNFFFSEDLPPLPDFPLVLSEEKALPWLRMSEGLSAVDESGGKIWRSSGNRIKFYLRVDDGPEGDLRLTLRGKPYDLYGPRPDLSVGVFVGDRWVGTWKAGCENEAGGTFIVPARLLKEAFEAEGRLLTLMLRIPAVPFSLPKWETASFGLELERVELLPWREKPAS
ncbi:MAG: hypothetical protein LBR61_07700 [Synergistaceae bacterium]|nr:hypothetical protein [Synergistaceae bacterium]